MKAEPEEAHRWLEQMLGDWQVRTAGSDGEPDGSGPWTEHVRSLHGLWIVCEGQGTMPGGSFGETLMTLGYNPETKRYIGTWVGSMLTHMWVYDGELDAEGKPRQNRAVPGRHNAPRSLPALADGASAGAGRKLERHDDGGIPAPGLTAGRATVPGSRPRPASTRSDVGPFEHATKRHEMRRAKQTGGRQWQITANLFGMN